VDVAKDCQALVARVLEGDREAADLLVAMGEPAIASVASRLPGPVSAGSQAQLGDQRASQCGLMLEVLARIGRPSVPFIAVRAADSDPQVRTWATRLLGELPSPEAVRSVVPRLSDKNSEVRHAALAAARMLLAHSDTQDRLSVELEQLVSSALSKVHRLAGVRALLELRHAAAVPVLLPLVVDEDEEIAEAAHNALVGVTRQDHGRREDQWRTWWEAHRSRHRIEWLIDGLMHESGEIRREAGDELKSLTREYFGYYDDLPPAERAEAQDRYREWWEDRGKAKFT
jgi:HEAT repeat protein